MSAVVRLKHRQTGAVVTCKSETAAKLGREWDAIGEVEPAKPTRRSSRKSSGDADAAPEDSG